MTSALSLTFLDDSVHYGLQFGHADLHVLSAQTEKVTQIKHTLDGYTLLTVYRPGSVSERLLLLPAA